MPEKPKPKPPIHNIPKMVTINIILRWSRLCVFIFVVSCSAQLNFGSDTILQGQQLKDWEFLRSANKAFTLRFFSLDPSGGRYLGIFLDQQTEPVWVANRHNSINDTSGVLMITATDGMLRINYSGGNVVVTNTSPVVHGKSNTSATLLDDGNFVVRQVSPNGSTNGMILWQSFDDPTDTLLPGMKLGTNLKTGQRWLLTSWISYQLPLPGSFTLGVDINATNQLTIWWHENALWTSGDWRKEYFANLKAEPPYDEGNIHFKFISNGNENSFTYTNAHGKHTPLRLNPDGSFVSSYISHDNTLVHCATYSSSAVSPGCAVYASHKCTEGYLDDEAFDKIGISGFTSSHLIHQDFRNLSIIDCGRKCRQNCSCLAYASLNSDGTGCFFWDREGNKDFSYSTGSTDVYIRKAWKKRHWRLWWTKVFVALGGALLLLVCICICIFCIRRKYKKKEKNMLLPELVDKRVMENGMSKGKHHKMNEIQQFSFKTIEMATNNFSMENKLGEGGFGPVYKGKLLDGQEIAIKRLSKTSSQGLEEFKNEIELIVKLQHNNLVRLLGCCIHQEELMLVYDYMPNKSLDFFLFDPKKGELLKWANRMNIIEGIAQGLLYLHRHSRLKVIHRDLKASNILLDMHMTPKISDFGMARIFGMQDSEANTKRIVGTRGYMSPEYAINGVVSTKIDVFSFGVLTLEIVSGKKNHKSYHSERPLNLIGLAWELWIEGRAVDLIDTRMDISNHKNELERCINVGLLCVQDSAIDRPSMADVILMLKNELLQLPTPKQPAFFMETSTADKDIEESQEINCTNKLSTSIMEAR